MPEKKRHVYSKHIEKKNLNGYIVNRSVPFLKLYDAEEFCMAEGVQPDKDHLIYDPKNARLLALMVLPELRRLRDLLDAKWNDTHEKFKAKAAMISRMESENRDLLVDAEIKVHQERLNETLGALREISTQILLIRNRIYELETLSRLIVKE